MATLTDYLHIKGDVPFTILPLCEVDYVLLSQLAILALNDIVPSDGTTISLADAMNEFAADEQRMTSNLGLIIPPHIRTNCVYMATTARYGSLLLSNYIKEIDESKHKQFAAVTVHLPDNTLLPCYTGTDDTLAGWRENFNLIYCSPTESQKQAVQYLNELGQDNNKRLVVCGHSKGGNLAMYADLHCDKEIQERINLTINIDGPGLQSAEVENLPSENFHRILAYMPQTSIIGRLFEHREEIVVVNSNTYGFNQHDVFSWEVEGSQFVRSQTTEEAILVQNKINGILNKMDEEERHQFVDVGYEILCAANSKTLTDVSKNFRNILTKYLFLDIKRRKPVSDVLRALISDREIRRIFMRDLTTYKKEIDN